VGQAGSGLARRGEEKKSRTLRLCATFLQEKQAKLRANGRLSSSSVCREASMAKDVRAAALHIAALLFFFNTKQ
jgi:hypothetical protein